MKNETIILTVRNMIKNRIALCTSDQQKIFKRIYATNMDDDLDSIIDEISPEKLECAFTQIENTLKK